MTKHSNVHPSLIDSPLVGKLTCTVNGEYVAFKCDDKQFMFMHFSKAVELHDVIAHAIEDDERLYEEERARIEAMGFGEQAFDG